MYPGIEALSLLAEFCSPQALKEIKANLACKAKLANVEIKLIPHENVAAAGERHKVPAPGVTRRGGWAFSGAPRPRGRRPGG